ncbi:DNA polymerase-3 subunit epsilon [Andreprevotia lacus DSM 23236]|jgi:DNA polymerase-3 subunit epsilon|uniref:DNA-directed DNA polymerase n=1 Tax=Andreprevotia lacus DSM 23236 TaxID=1121001 RepID=A0A1W1XZ29_9NEIS|nr:exonuclease domain-containing protein [Andreprevotia lacus]SMC28801.1 DNA polymerase-3 subunit epsilon [Andreprevotia lacus DSM 23236]
MNAYYSAPLVLVDLETTGANPERDRITEIGIVQIDEAGVRTWSSLVNPQRAIPAFIQQLTGIDDAMVADAPAFAALVDEVLPLLQGRVFVAHNARFDYGFLRAEFKRLGLAFRASVLCTVKLSRALYPDQYKHSLDALIARHGLQLSGGRHRALTDAELLQQFLDVALREHGHTHVHAAIDELTRQPPLPAAIDPARIDELPEGPGVVAYYDAAGAALYVDRHNNLYKGVLAQLSGARKGQGYGEALRQDVARVDAQECPGELGALLLEARWLQQLRPRLNPQTRAEHAPCFLRLIERDGSLVSQVSPAEDVDLSAGGALLFGPFRAKREVTRLLNKLAEGYGLCRQVLGLDARPKAGAGACNAVSQGKCRGACCGREPLATHNARLLMALAKHRFAAWPYSGPIGIAEGPEWAPQLHVLDRWMYLGTVHDDSELPSLLAESAPEFNLDVYKLLVAEVKRGRKVMVLGRGLAGLADEDGV